MTPRDAALQALLDGDPEAEVRLAALGRNEGDAFWQEALDLLRIERRLIALHRPEGDPVAPILAAIRSEARRPAGQTQRMMRAVHDAEGQQRRGRSVTRRRVGGRPAGRRGPGSGLALAALALGGLVAGLGLWWVVIADRPVPAPEVVNAAPAADPAPEPQRVVATIARTIRLPDGATAELAPGSELTITGRGPHRLQKGRAVFSVEPRAAGQPPFRVDTEGVAVEVLGTRFTLDASAHRDRVAVEHGRVRVERPAGEGRVLAAGESLVLWRDPPRPWTSTPDADSIESGRFADGVGLPQRSRESADLLRWDVRWQVEDAAVVGEGVVHAAFTLAQPASVQIFLELRDASGAFVTNLVITDPQAGPAVGVAHRYDLSTWPDLKYPGDADAGERRLRVTAIQVTAYGRQDPDLRVQSVRYQPR